MTIKQLKQKIADLPDDSTVGIWDSENDCECEVEDTITPSDEGDTFNFHIILSGSI